MTRTLAFFASLLAAPLALADAPQTTRPAAPEWAVEGQWMDTCSCTMPCPCWKSEKPTFGKDCQEMYYFHVDKGHYGAVKLDGVDVVAVALSPAGKTMDQATADKDYKVANMYLSKALAPDVAKAAEALFTEFTLIPLESGKKHAVKHVELKAKIGAEGARITIPKILELDVKKTAKPYGQDTSVTGFFGKGVEGVQERYDFSDDGFAWKLTKHNATFAPFSWSSKQAAAAAAAAAAKK
ncbi:MAG TPA: DUF1326 domain-containing protein [Polyangia bacterium]